MFTHLFRRNDVARREFVVDLARSCLGVSVLPVALSSALEAADKAADKKAAKPAAGKSYPIASGAKAKQIIYLSMNGAMSQLDTFDPKPASKVQGETKA